MKFWKFKWNFENLSGILLLILHLDKLFVLIVGFTDHFEGIEAAAGLQSISLLEYSGHWLHLRCYFCLQGKQYPWDPPGSFAGKNYLFFAQSTDFCTTFTLQIHCENLPGSDGSTVSVTLADSSALQVGDSYRFCLVLLKDKNGQSELVVGCSNITRLLPTTPQPTDISSFERISAGKLPEAEEETNVTREEQTEAKTLVENQTVAFFNNVHINKSFLPGLALGVLIMSICVLIWGATKLKQSRHAPTVATCYTASGNGVVGNCQDAENHNNRYFKLQATTSLWGRDKSAFRVHTEPFL